MPAKGELAHPLPYNLLPPPHLAEQVHGRKQGTQQRLYCWAEVGAIMDTSLQKTSA